MAEKKKLSTADILAAARKGTAATPAAASTPAPGETPTADESSAAAPEVNAAATEPAAPAPAAKPKPAAAGGARPSVADILAAARAAKAGGAAPEAASKAAPKPAAEKPAAKPKVDKPAAKAAPAAAGAAVRDTSSILAAARAAAKPGPVSKSEAAARLKPSGPEKAAKGEAGVVPPMPTKPEYAKPKAKEAAADGQPRRFFLAVLMGSFLAVGFTTLTSTVGLWTLALLRFMFPNVLTEPPSRFKIGFPSDFPPGVVEEKFKAQFGIWPVNVEYKGQRQIVALKTVCTHLGCTPNWLEAEQKFKCPCHGSGFYKDGVNFEGPAPRPLERYAIRLADDGQLEVDKSRTFQEELGQWADAACFVQV